MTLALLPRERPVAVGVSGGIWVIDIGPPPLYRWDENERSPVPSNGGDIKTLCCPGAGWTDAPTADPCAR
jgi:hypothetical protein